jgi:hypothetical protein
MTETINGTLLFDRRVECYSLLTAVSASDYLALVEGAYEVRGGLKHQRDPLKTTTAKRIRSRMVSDIRRGAILPPVVIGVVIDDGTMDIVKEQDPDETVELIRQKLVPSISIIDGMARTTALLDAIAEDDGGVVAKMPIRIEFWIAKSTDSRDSPIPKKSAPVPFSLGSDRPCSREAIPGYCAGAPLRLGDLQTPRRPLLQILPRAHLD